MKRRNIGYLKSEIAIIQLRRSIQLFNSSDYISSLTLAGAANEILGKLALNRIGYNSIDGDKTFWDGMAEIYKRNKPSKGEVIKAINKIKNSIKHHDSESDILVEADFKFEAQFQIDSAIRNYLIVFDEEPSDRILSKYVKSQWT